jgi:hypothetical protein
MNTNSQCYSQSALSPVPSARKKRFFSTLLNLFPFLRFSSFKRDQVSISATTIETPIIIGVDRKAEKKTIPSSTSRCRRSAANQIQSEKNPSSKLNHLEQKASINSVSDTSMLTRKSYRQSIYLQLIFACYLLLRCHSIFQKRIIRVYPSSILLSIFEKLVRIDAVIDIMNANIFIGRNKNIFDPL